MATKYVKQYGLYRTGTNYLRALLEHNFDVRVLVNVLGWKHGPYQDPPKWLDEHAEDDHVLARTNRKGRVAWKRVDIPPWDLLESWRDGEIGMVCISKHPMLFAYSIERWGKVPVEQACEEYNERYAEWMERCYNVQYEALIDSVPWSMHFVGCYRGLTPLRKATDIHQLYQDVTRTAKPSEDGNQNLGDPFDKREFYLSGAYREHMSERAKRAATDIIDWRLAERMGYQQEQPA